MDEEGVRLFTPDLPKPTRIYIQKDLKSSEQTRNLCTRRRGGNRGMIAPLQGKLAPAKMAVRAMGRFRGGGPRCLGMDGP